MTMEEPGVFTSGLGNKGSVESFTSDDPRYGIGIVDDEAVMGTPVSVEFNSDGGSPVATQNIVTGMKVTEPDEPKKTGYIFVGWFLVDEEYYFDTVVKDNLILTAKWVDRVRSLALEPGQSVTLTDEATRIESNDEALVKVEGMKVTAAEGEGGEAGLTVYADDIVIVRYSVTVSAISTGVFKLPDELTEVKANAFAELPNAKKVILGGNVKTLDRDAFAGTTLSQMVVNSMTLTLPEGFAFNKEAGLTILCLEDSEIAKQLTGEAFEDVNISVVHPAE